MGDTKNVKKLGSASLVAVFVAYTCSASAVPQGAVIGEGSTFMTGFLGILLGAVIGTFIALSLSWIGYKTGQTKDVVWKTMFGLQGSRICSFLVAFCLAFFACFDIFIGGQALYNLMPEASGLKNVGFCVAVFIILTLTIIGGIYGITGVKWISTLTIPIAFILFLIIYVASYNKAGGMEALLAYTPVTANYTIASAAQALVGTWMGGFVGMVDLTTQAKNTKAVVAASVCGLIFIMLCFLVGQMGFIGTGMKTVADLCVALGGAIFVVGNLFVLTAQANTTPACNLMYSNSFASCLRLPKNILAVVFPVIAAILAFVIMYGPGVDMITRITSTVATLMSPLIGVMLAEFYIVCKKNIELKPDAQLPAVKVSAVACLVIGVIISFIFRMIPGVPIPAFLTLLLAGLAQITLRLVVKMN